MHPAYYHMAHACVMCFDVTRKQTYKNLPVWYKELRDYRKDIPVVCIANKIDVDAKVGGVRLHARARERGEDGGRVDDCWAKGGW